MIKEEIVVDVLARMLFELLKCIKKKADTLEDILADMREKNISFRDEVIERTLEIAAGREIPIPTEGYVDESTLIDLFAKMLKEIIDFYPQKRRNEVMKFWLRYLRMKGFSRVFINKVEQKIKS